MLTNDVLISIVHQAAAVDYLVSVGNRAFITCHLIYEERTLSTKDGTGRLVIERHVASAVSCCCRNTKM